MPPVDWDRAVIPVRKLTHYLLSDTHEDGKHKAAFFRAHGYKAADSAPLASTLVAHGRGNPVVSRQTTEHGTKVTVEGPALTPRGTTIALRSVWSIEDGAPRLITAYPS